MPVTIRMIRLAALACACLACAAVPARAQATPPPPVPLPFPGSAAPPARTPPAPATPPAGPLSPAQTPPAQTTAAAPAAPPPAAPAGAPTEAALGVKFFPGAEYLESFDAGMGQRLFLFGTNAAYADVVAFYKKELGTGGNEVFKTPPMQQFDIDKFQEDKMAFRPSVVVKDYTWTGLSGALAEGYLFVDGTTEKRFKTIVQIVPAPGK